MSLHPKLLPLLLPKAYHLPTPTVKDCLPDDPEYCGAEEQEQAEELHSTTTGKWIVFSREIEDAILDGLKCLKTGKSLYGGLFPFAAGYEVGSDHLSDWHVNQEPLVKLFHDFPVFEWNTSESSHEVCPALFAAFLGCTVTALTREDIQAAYAIMYKRFTDAGAKMDHAEAPVFDLTPYLSALPIATAPTITATSTTSGGILPITSAKSFPAPSTEDCKTFLSHAFEELHVKGVNPHKLGVTAKGWKRTSKVKDKSTGEYYRDFSHDDALTARIYERGSKLVITEITGLPIGSTIPASKPAIPSSDFI